MSILNSMLLVNIIFYWNLHLSLVYWIRLYRFILFSKKMCICGDCWKKERIKQNSVICSNLEKCIKPRTFQHLSSDTRNINMTNVIYVKRKNFSFSFFFFPYITLTIDLVLIIFNTILNKFLRYNVYLRGGNNVPAEMCK